MELPELIARYEARHSSRALGGIRALSGFDYQLRVHLADYAEALASGVDIERAGNGFAYALESLSDFTSSDGSAWVCVQVKRALTRASLRSAAVEFATIDEFLTIELGTKGVLPIYRVVGQRSELSQDFSWRDIELAAELRADNEGVATRWDLIRSENRVEIPQVAPDPWWRLVAVVFSVVERPFEFARRALDLCLRRPDQSASETRDKIAELFSNMRSHETATTARLLTPEDFARLPVESTRPLRVGHQPTLALLRDHQFMSRPKHVRVACRDLEHLLAIRDAGDRYGLNIFWITGRSGAGKSVLLLEVMEEMIQRGHRILWLEDSAAEVTRLLNSMADELMPNSAALPDVLFVDDIYAPHNQQTLNLPALERTIAAQPYEQWPVVVTCGPPEFKDRLEKDTIGGSIRLHDWTLALVDADEADQLKRWYKARTGKAPSTASAFNQKQGLIVSMAYEMHFEKNNLTLEPFANRFSARLKASNLDKPLCIPLALNRLYLWSPTAWLPEPVREQFELINKERDFSVFEIRTHGELLRLTHPHISDAIYRAVRDPKIGRAFANDLADAITLAATTHLPTLRHLFRILTNDDERIRERLADVDIEHLARRTAKAWRRGMAAKWLSDPDVAAEFWVAWACWDAQYPNFEIGRLLGYRSGKLLERARSELTHSGTPWAYLWSRLERAFDVAPELAMDGLAWLSRPSSQVSRSWSFVYERLWKASGRDPKCINIDDLARRAETWLVEHPAQPDWHYVWKTLLVPAADNCAAERNESALEIGFNWLFPPHQEEHRCDHPAWSFVWRDVLTRFPESVFEKRAQLLRLGVRWLADRAGLAAWTYIWVQLLDEKHLPKEVDRNALLLSGCDWLVGREDLEGWAFVWQRLLDETILSEEIDRQALLLRGFNWLAGREDVESWNFVWQRLLDEKQLPQEVERDALLRRGYNWLAGREDCKAWEHVWEVLFDDKHLPQDVDRGALLLRGYDWLAGREDLEVWPFLWQRLLDEKHLPREVEREALLVRGYNWLAGRENHKAWDHVWQVLFETAALPSTINRTTLAERGMQWLGGGRQRHNGWSFVWQRLVASSGSNHLPNLLQSGIAWLNDTENQNRGEWDKLLEQFLDSGGTDEAVFDRAKNWVWSHLELPQLPPLVAKLLVAASHRRDFDALAEWLNNWVAAHPNTGRARFVAGFLRSRISDVRSVELRSCPGWNDLFKWLARQPSTDMEIFAALRRSRELVADDRMTDAVVELDRAAERAQTAMDWGAISIEYSAAGDYTKAEAAARRAIHIDPECWQAWLSLAKALETSPGREDEALKALRQNAELENHATAWHRLGKAYLKAGQYEEAITAARNAINLNDNDAKTWRTLAIGLSQANRVEDATQAWQRVNDLCGTSHNDQSGDDLASAVRADPMSASAWKSLVSAYRSLGKPSELLSVARQAIVDTPSSVSTAIVVAEDLLSTTPDAVAMFLEDCIRLSPQNGHFLHLLGAARRKSGNSRDAVATLRQACDLEPRRANYWYALGKALEDCSEANEAKSAYRTALRLDPSYTKARRALKDLLAKTPD